MNIYAVISLGILVIFPLFFHIDYFLPGFYFHLKQLKDRLLFFTRESRKKRGLSPGKSRGRQTTKPLNGALSP
jgi:hypothetical protein